MSKNKSEPIKLVEMPHIAISVVKNEEGKWVLVEVAFDLVTGKAEVRHVTNTGESGRDFGIDAFKKAASEHNFV